MRVAEQSRDLRGRALVGTRTVLTLLLILLAVAGSMLAVLQKEVGTSAAGPEGSAPAMPPATDSPLPPSPVVPTTTPPIATVAPRKPPVRLTPPAVGEARQEAAPEAGEAAATVAAAAGAESPDPEFDALLASALDTERQRLWALALTDFQDALARQPESAAAHEGVERARHAIAAEKFQAAMSAGLTALERRQYAEALQTFREAQALQPDSQELRDGIARSNAGLRQLRIAALKRKAEKFASRERWGDAAGVYARALAIDARLAFARDGKSRSERLGKASVQLRYYLERPELLYSDKALAQARRLLQDLPALPEHAPALRTAVTQLRERVRVAATFLPVELRSDGTTAVSVYHVGRLGRFESRHLDLRPGDYTVVGSRPGYRDVRLQLRVRPGAPPPVVRVVCEEPL